MHYFAGIFDAEGWISLISSGHFIIGLEVTHKQTVHSFCQQFGGKIYYPTRKAKKQVYSWRISTNIVLAKNFIQSIAPLSHIKNDQLLLLYQYLGMTKKEKRIERASFIAAIAKRKKPITRSRADLIFEPSCIVSDAFFKWFAGFIDGDGTFTVYEYQNYKKSAFDSWIAIFNTFAEPLIFVQQYIKGSISQYKGTNFPIWKWVCNQKSSLFLCQSIEPFLVIKKKQCQLVQQYLHIAQLKNKGIPYTTEQVRTIKSIITEIKHFNSL